MSEPEVKIKQVVACEEIRREDNGKEFLIGVYGGSIVVPQFPAPLVLSFWIQFEVSKAIDSIPLEFRLFGDGDIRFFHFRAGLQTVRVGRGSLALPPAPIFLQIPTTLRLQIKEGDFDWNTIEELKVEKGDIPGRNIRVGAQIVPPPAAA